jgi:hypothetical protein
MGSVVDCAKECVYGVGDVEVLVEVRIVAYDGIEDLDGVLAFIAFTDHGQVPFGVLDGFRRVRFV